MFCENLKVCYSFSKPFKIVFPNRQDGLFNGNPIPPEELEKFTDGFKCEEGTGAGIWDRRPRGEIRGSEGWFVIENLARGYKNEVMSIISDFQVALRALDSL